MKNFEEYIIEKVSVFCPLYDFFSFTDMKNFLGRFLWEIFLEIAESFFGELVGAFENGLLREFAALLLF